MRWAQEDDAYLTAAAAVLHRLAPTLAVLDRTRRKTEFYSSSIREEDQEGFDVPTTLVAASGKRAIKVLILILLND